MAEMGPAEVTILGQRYVPAGEIEALRERVRDLENRANLIAGLGMADCCLSGYQRAAAFILTGSWPPGAAPS